MLRFVIMNAEYLVKTGRQHFAVLMGVVIFLSLLNSAIEVFLGVSYGILFTQLATPVALIVLTWAVLKGYKRKNLLFSTLLFIGVFTFYEAGTRTPDLRKTDMGFIPLVTLLFGLVFIFGGIYLAYSTEIKAFLDQKVYVRNQQKEEQFQ